jgi:bacterioferritin-associated ferredoxin
MFPASRALAAAGLNRAGTPCYLVDDENQYQYQRARGTMILCICKSVSEREIEAAVRSGARTLAAIGDHCGAGTDCGMCHEAIEERLEGSCASCPRARDCHATPPALASAAL